MTRQIYETKNYGGSAPENYDQYFVPAIGGPLAKDLVALASIRPGERVLDVACGTGAVTRLVADQVGQSGSVAGLDLNPGMLAVARARSSAGHSIDWFETSAEAIPLPDASFDVALCQMGLQFMPNKIQALKEMRRVVGPKGRVVLNFPGPVPEMFSIFGDSLARHIDAKCRGFVEVVFSLNDADILRDLMKRAGFDKIQIDTATKTLELPKPEDFLWQYIHSSPLAGLTSHTTEAQRQALTDEVCDAWHKFVVDGGMRLEVRMTTVSAS
jgi:ubiquinone/menaquinone biosynthesis C-methylase UbiE